MGALRYKLTPEDCAFCDHIICAGFHAIKYHTLQVVEDLLDASIPGDFAECGVLFGAQPAIMLRSLLRRGIRDRKVHLFDSFQGIPRATEEDPPAQQAAYGMSTGVLISSGVSVSSIANTLNNLKLWGVFDPQLIELHPGWFQHTLPKANVGALALLRVDVDLYESTRAVYESLYSKVVSGGYVIDDDYGAPEERTACRRALENTIGCQNVLHVEGQETTAWWRKP